MNLFTLYADRIATALRALYPLLTDADLARIAVEPPREAAHGDLATNAAMVLAKAVGDKPRAIAEKLAEALKADDGIAAVEIAGPGFINLRLRNAVYQRLLGALLADPQAYGRSAMGRGVKVNVEYVSANPTGPMHVGHCRGAVVGDALAGVLGAAGFDVTREYYINDAGGQIEVLARSVYLRYLEALGEAIGDIPEGLYPGDYLVPVGAALKAGFGDGLKAMPEAEWLPIVKEAAIDAMMAMIRADLAALGIHHDVFFSEHTLHEHFAGKSRIDALLDDLAKRGLVYTGTLPPPKGQLPDDWEDREQTLFRATLYGDDIDRPLLKSDGSYTYFAADVAYMKDKFDRGFRQMIFVLGADHGGYVKRLQAVGAAVSDGSAEVIVRLAQLVRLFRDGEPVKMSKRSGNFVTLREVVDEVGAGVVRFIMLMRKNDAPLDFDFVKVKEFSKDNPVFYVQYAHARTHSIGRQAEELTPDAARADPAEAPLELLVDDGEIGLLKRIAEYPRVIEAAATHHEPHRLAFYLHDLASDFHAHWNRGKENVGLRFVNPDDRNLTRARLALVVAVRTVLNSGLGLLGVDAEVEMR